MAGTMVDMGTIGDASAGYGAAFGAAATESINNYAAPGAPAQAQPVQAPAAPASAAAPAASNEYVLKLAPMAADGGFS